MLASIRKFSNSIYAKILLGIIILPFVFWGMGGTFTSGNRNIVVVIDKEKYSAQDFGYFIQKIASTKKNISDEEIEELLSLYISEKLIEKEIENFGIKLSDVSLSKLIKHQKDFKRENKFSRAEYEKFLIVNNISAFNFESSLSKNEKKKQLLDFISGGLSPSKFLVNDAYNKIKQKRSIQLIDLNEAYKDELNFSEKQIKDYYEKNIKNYEEAYKTAKILELTPQRLVSSDNFNEAYFKKIDQIDDLVIQGENFDNILFEFNLQKPEAITFNKLGNNIKAKEIKALPKKIFKNIFSRDISESIFLLESEDKFFIIEVIKTESIEKGIQDKNVHKKILSDLKIIKKGKLTSEIIEKINKNNFKKSDFDELSVSKNLSVKEIYLENKFDIKELKGNIINQIYSFPEKKVIVAHNISLTENFLIYIDKVENVVIDKNSEEYEKYLNLSKAKITSRLFNTYDNYIKKRYEIDINYKALESVKNYFN